MEKTVGLSGPGNDFKHQIIIACIVHALMDRFKKTKAYKNYISIPEFQLKPESNQVPDITIWKIAKGSLSSAVVFIEICNPKMMEKDASKLSQLMLLPKHSSVNEAFVIDKENLQVKRIYRISAKKISALKTDSKIQQVNMDLSKVINDMPIKWKK